MIWGLDGFAWGANLIVARETITEDMLPEKCEIFTDRIIDEMKISTYGVIHLTVMIDGKLSMNRSIRLG